MGSILQWLLLHIHATRGYSMIRRSGQRSNPRCGISRNLARFFSPDLLARLVQPIQHRVLTFYREGCSIEMSPIGSSRTWAIGNIQPTKTWSLPFDLA